MNDSRSAGSAGLARVWEVARLEWRFDVLRPLFWFLLGTLALFAFGMSTGTLRLGAGDSSVGGKKAFLTSMFANAQIFSVLDFTLFALFFAAVAGMPVLRDEELRASDLLRATPLRPREYAIGKFLGVLGVYATAMAAQVALSILFNHALTGAEEAEFIGPLALSNYLVPMLAFVVPMVVFLAGSTFAIGTLTRRPALVFLFPIVLLFAYVMFLIDKEQSDTRPWLNALLKYGDPSGFRWLQETWLRVDLGVDHYNVRSIEFSGAFVASRLAFTAIGVGLAVFTAWRLERRSRGEPAPAAGSLTHAETSGMETVGLATRGVAIPPMNLARPSFLSSFLTIFAFEARAMLKHPVLWLFVPLFALQVVSAQMEGRGAFDTELLVTPGSAAVAPMFWLGMLVCVLLLFFMTESLHREAAQRMDGVVGATPIGTGPLLLGKILASSVVAVAILVASFVGFVIAILSQKRVPIEVSPFVVVWGVLLLPTYFLWSAFVAAAYGWTKSRLATNAIALAAIAVTFYAAYIKGRMSWVFNWNLSGGDPNTGVLRWSDFGAFDLIARGLVMNRILVVLAGVFFAVLAIRLFPRQESDPTRTIERLKPKALLKSTLRLSWILVPVLALGIWLNYEVRSGFQGAYAEKAAKDYWRRNVQTWKDAPKPDLKHVELNVDLHPDRGALESRGSYALVNAEAKPLKEIALTIGPHWRDVKWTLDGRDFSPEDRVGLQVFALAEPLATGAAATIGWSFHGEFPSGITKNGGGRGEFVLPDSVVMVGFSPDFAPLIGFQDGAGIDDDNRTDSKEYPDDFFEGITRAGFTSGQPFTVKTTITGPAEFVLNGVGERVADTVENGRRTTVFVTDHPVRIFNVVGGRGLVERKGAGTSLWHHPAHGYNVGEMMEALDGARKYFSEWFYPYPWKELKVTEFAGHASYAQGFGTNITFSEQIGFLVNSKPNNRLAFMVTAHEAAHQWWGNLLTPGEGPGTNILSEGMAHFSTILLMEQVKGEYARIEFCRRMEQKYNDDRQVDSERPLVKIDGSKPGDTTCTYDKGGFVAWMLLAQIGRDNMLRGLRDFIAKFQGSRDHAALQDFVNHMRAYAPDAAAYDAFMKQWCFEVVVPRFALSEVTRSPPSDGPWMARGAIENRGTGRVRVEVAALNDDRFDSEGAEKADHHEARCTVEVGAGEKVRFEIPCDFEPKKVVVDPDVKQLMLFRKEASTELR